MFESRAQSLLNVFSGHCPQLVVASSMDVYQAFDVLNGKAEGIEPTPITEESKLRERRFPYSDQANSAPTPQMAEFWRKYDKISVEELLFAQSAIAVTVIRLPMVYGERDFQHRMWDYIRAIQDGRPHIVLDEGALGWRACRGYVDNMAHALALAALHPSSGQRLYVAAEPALTESQWIAGIAEAMGTQIEVYAVPREFWPSDHECQGNLAQHLDVDSGKIRRELGYCEIVSQPEAFKLSVAWERANPPAQQDDAAKLYASEDTALTAMRSTQAVAH
jgi:nucleoside-diphosphate-sugar epimerase